MADIDTLREEVKLLRAKERIQGELVPNHATCNGWDGSSPSPSKDPLLTRTVPSENSCRRQRRNGG